MEQNLKQDRINEIMDSFSFSKTERILTTLDVKFQLANGKLGNADEKFLRAVLRKALNEVCDATISQNSKEDWNLNMKVGPFHIRRFGGIKNEKEWEELSLTFIAESYSTEKQPDITYVQPE
jgi:hypothetical protein